MTSNAANLYSDETAQGAPAALLLRVDQVYLYLVMFTASAAVFRFGSINTYLWYLIYIWTVARLSLEIPALIRMGFQNWALFIWPALALASVLWSAAPAATLRGGLQLLLTTVIAIFIGARFSLHQILVSVFIILFGAAAASFALLHLGAPDLFADAGGFQGIFAHKNTLGIRMNILIAIGFVFLFTTRMRFLALAALVIGAYLLLISKSATSQILGLATPMLLMALAVLKFDTRTIALSMAAGVGFVAALSIGLFTIGLDPVSYVLDGFGKDATLTGRTWLWERGLEEIGKHPIIGGGYQAFWAHERSSEVLWIRHITLNSVKGFHNVGVEVWNDLGLPGVISLLAVLIWYAFRTFRFHVTTPSYDGLIPCFFILILVVSASLNNSFFRQHELMHILLCAFFAATWLPARAVIRRPLS